MLHELSYPSRQAEVGSVVVLGAQWGDEGKGKIVDVLCADMDIVARCQGGSNAGHTIKVGENTYKFHLLPSGLIHPNTTCVIGNGVVIHLPSFFNELEDLTSHRENGASIQVAYGKIPLQNSSNRVTHERANMMD
jgi:adenylosuccinate synthase